MVFLTTHLYTIDNLAIKENTTSADKTHVEDLDSVTSDGDNDKEAKVSSGECAWPSFESDHLPWPFCPYTYLNY